MAVVEFVVGMGLGRPEVGWGFDLIMGLRLEQLEQVMTGSGAKVSERHLVQQGQQGEEHVELNNPRQASAH